MEQNYLTPEDGYYRYILNSHFGWRLWKSFAPENRNWIDQITDVIWKYEDQPFTWLKKDGVKIYPSRKVDTDEMLLILLQVTE